MAAEPIAALRQGLIKSGPENLKKTLKGSSKRRGQLLLAPRLKRAFAQSHAFDFVVLI